MTGRSGPRSRSRPRTGTRPAPVVRGTGSRAAQFFGAPYVMLHSLSHLLINAISLECGYPASSIKERIYANRKHGYGILLYTAAADSYGTLGGLASAAGSIDHYLEEALEMRAALLERSGVCRARSGRLQSAALSARSGLPRLPVDQRDELRDVQRFPRSQFRRAHRGVSRGRVLLGAIAVDGRGRLSEILDVASDEVDRLVTGLAQGSIDPASSIPQLRKAGLLTHAEKAHAWLGAAINVFGSTPALLAALRLIQDERHHAARTALTAELVLTGPELERAEARETRVVVRELFEAARHSVLIVGYAFHGSDHIFEPLARQMSRSAALRVRLVVNVHFDAGRLVDETVRGFARDFLEDSWPFEPGPIYYDPRSLERPGPGRGIVHAKLIVVDEEVLYLGSANFTTAAFERNIEAGVRVKSSAWENRRRTSSIAGSAAVSSSLCRSKE